MVLEITLGSHFRLRSHFSENSVIMAGFIFDGQIGRRRPFEKVVSPYIQANDLLSCRNRVVRRSRMI